MPCTVLAHGSRWCILDTIKLAASQQTGGCAAGCLLLQQDPYHQSCGSASESGRSCLTQVPDMPSGLQRLYALLHPVASLFSPFFLSLEASLAPQITQSAHWPAGCRLAAGCARLVRSCRDAGAHAWRSVVVPCAARQDELSTELGLVLVLTCWGCTQCVVWLPVRST